MASTTQSTSPESHMGAVNRNPAAEAHFAASMHHAAAAHHHLEAAHQHNIGEHEHAKGHVSAATAHSEKAHELTRQATGHTSKQH